METLYLKKNHFFMYMKSSDSLKLKLKTIGITKIILAFWVLTINDLFYMFSYDLSILIKTLMFFIVIIGICYLLFTDTLNFKLGSVGLAVLDNINFSVEPLITLEPNIINIGSPKIKNKNKGVSELNFRPLDEIEAILEEKQFIANDCIEDFSKLIRREKIGNRISLIKFNDKNKFVYPPFFDFLNDIIEEDISTFYGKSRRTLFNFIISNFHKKGELFENENLRKRYNDWLNIKKNNTDIYFTMNQTCILSDFL